MVNHEPTSTSLEKHAKSLFDTSVDNLDGRTRSALTQARHAVLAELEVPRRHGWWRALGPVSGMVAAALVIAVMWGPVWTTPPNSEAGNLPLEDFDIVADAEDFELFGNLEFYAWLDSIGAVPNDG